MNTRIGDPVIRTRPRQGAEHSAPCFVTRFVTNPSVRRKEGLAMPYKLSHPEYLTLTGPDGTGNVKFLCANSRRC